MKKGTGDKQNSRAFVLFFTVLCIIVFAGVPALFAYKYMLKGNGSIGETVISTRNDVHGGVNDSLTDRMRDAAKNSDDVHAKPGDREAAVLEKDRGPYGKYYADAELCRIDRVLTADTASKEEAVIAFAGDILMDESYSIMSSMLASGRGIGSAFSESLLKEMRSADVFLVNNEFPYSESGTPTEEKQFTFRSSPTNVRYLKDMGVDGVSLANNHVYDFGKSAFLDTLDTLEGADILYAGAGRDISEAVKPMRFLVNGRMVAVLCATQIEKNPVPDTKGATATGPGVFRCVDPQLLEKAISDAGRDNDYVVVFIHWGTEKMELPDDMQLIQAKRYAEAGADAIIGAHSHCLQPVAFIDETPVVYSMGNFWFSSYTLDSCLVKMHIDTGSESPSKKDIHIEFMPAIQQGCRTRLLEGAEKERVREYVNSLSETAYIDADGFICR